jgi:hypothetical protein
MWLLVLTWLKNPIVRKILICVAGILVVLYFIRLYGNKQWEKGELKGRVTSTQLIEKVKQEEWKKVSILLKTKDLLLEEEKKNNQNQLAQLGKIRVDLKQSLTSGLTAIQNQMDGDYANIASIPTSELDTALRTISTKLKSAQ